MFSFKVHSSGSRDDLLHLCNHYNPGITVIRDVRKLNKGIYEYIVDVYEVTEYGVELLDWLRRGQLYASSPLKDEFLGPMWSDSHRTWYLHVTDSLPRHS